MNSADPLAQLEDILLPSAVPSWPPAWGWWLLGLMLLALVVIVIVVAIRHRRFYAVKRAALRAAASISNASEANQLLKVTCIHYFGHDKVAALYGEEWRRFLLSRLAPQHQAKVSDSLSTMIEGLYRPDQAADKQTLINMVSLWLMKARWRSHA